jgi:hypothetical protein
LNGLQNIIFEDRTEEDECRSYRISEGDNLVCVIYRTGNYYYANDTFINEGNIYDYYGNLTDEEQASVNAASKDVINDYMYEIHVNNTCIIVNEFEWIEEGGMIEWDGWYHDKVKVIKDNLDIDELYIGKRIEEEVGLPIYDGKTHELLGFHNGGGDKESFTTIEEKEYNLYIEEIPILEEDWFVFDANTNLHNKEPNINELYIGDDRQCIRNSHRIDEGLPIYDGKTHKFLGFHNGKEKRHFTTSEGKEYYLQLYQIPPAESTSKCKLYTTEKSGWYDICERCGEIVLVDEIGDGICRKCGEEEWRVVSEAFKEMVTNIYDVLGIDRKEEKRK